MPHYAWTSAIPPRSAAHPHVRYRLRTLLRRAWLRPLSRVYTLMRMYLGTARVYVSTYVVMNAIDNTSTYVYPCLLSLRLHARLRLWVWECVG